MSGALVDVGSSLHGQARPSHSCCIRIALILQTRQEHENREFTSSLVNGNANFTILVDSTDPNGNATFSITVTNSTTSKITLTKASITDGSFVTIDT